MNIKVAAFTLSEKSIYTLVFASYIKTVYSVWDGFLCNNSDYFLPLFDRPKINIVFSNTLKVRSCIANQIYNSKTIL